MRCGPTGILTSAPSPDAGTTTTARTLGSAVVELNGSVETARVLVGVDVTSPREHGNPSCLRRRIQLEMSHDGAVWKVDRLTPVGAANPVPGACPTGKALPPK
jgi:hypothetical protein